MQIDKKVFKDLSYRDKTIENTTYNKCRFKHVDFSFAKIKDCSFVDCVFTRCTLDGVVFDNTTMVNCRLNREVISKPPKILRYKDWHIIITECSMKINCTTMAHKEWFSKEDSLIEGIQEDIGTDWKDSKEWLKQECQSH